METKEIVIKKAKLYKGGQVEASFSNEDGDEVIIKGSHKCHEDLKTALAGLVPYFADLTEQKEADHINWGELESEYNADLLRKIAVVGVSIGGGDSSRTITMTGHRILQTSRVLNINAPAVEVGSDAALDWEHTCNFDIAVQDFLYEVKLYLTEHKWQKEAPELNFDENMDDPFGGTDVPDDVPAVDNVA